MRLIDVDAEIKQIEKEIESIYAKIDEWESNRKDREGYHNVDAKIAHYRRNIIDCKIEIARLRNYPTVEAEPVIHGEWLVSAGGKVCTCPVCGDEFDNTCNYDIRKDWKRCPVCETKMG